MSLCSEVNNSAASRSIACSPLTVAQTDVATTGSTIHVIGSETGKEEEVDLRCTLALTDVATTGSQKDAVDPDRGNHRTMVASTNASTNFTETGTNLSNRYNYLV